MGRNPDTRVILASYSDESAERFARRNREKLRAWGPALFGVEPGGVNRSTEFELVRSPGTLYETGAGSPGTDGVCRGRLISRGVFAGITGNPANLLIIDDPFKNREEADSPVCRQKLWAEWGNSIKSRLAAGAKVIVVMTPWHEDDLAGRILKTEENVRLLRFPVEAEAVHSANGTNGVYGVTGTGGNTGSTGTGGETRSADPLGRLPGEPLCPELGKDKTWLEQFKRAYLNDPQGGQRAWMALYLCRPRTEEGGLVRRNWWRFYDRLPPCDAQIVSVDAAFKDGEHNDFVAVTVWGKRGEDYFLLDCRNRHLDFIGTLREIRAVREAYPKARAVLIEDKANGSAVLSVLRREMFCIPVEPKGGKAARVHAVSPAVESGHVFLPKAAPWLEEFLNQWTAFPAAPHDDMVDSSTQALLYLFGIPCGVRSAPPENQEAVLADAGLYEVY